MVVISDGKKSGVSFFYPIFSRVGRREIKVIPLESYQGQIKIFVSISTALFVFGLLLLNRDVYSDTLYNIFAASVLIYGAIRIWRFRANATILLAAGTSVRRAPIIAGIDFSGYFASLTLMEIVFSKQSPGDMGQSLALAGVLFFCLAILPLLNSIAFYFGLGVRLPQIKH